MNENLQRLAYEIADMSPTVLLIWNYLERISSDVSKAKNTDDMAYIVHSLRNLKGLDSVMDSLTKIDEKITTYSDQLLGYCEESEVETND